MTNRHVLFGVIGIIFTAAVIIFLSRSIFNPSPEYVDDSDFNQIGTLVYGNPGMKADTWFLVYEEPGKPALYKELKFDSASACAVNAPAAPCDLDTLEAGVRVRVEGRIVGETVLVRTVQLPEVIITESSGTTTNPTKGATTTESGTKATSTSSTTTSTAGTSTATTTASDLAVKLYYYNPKLDNTQCSRAGLVPVTRIIPRTNTPLQDTIKLLLRGEVTAEERTQGITTEFPLSRVTLLSASSDNGNLTLTFRDPKNRTSGGSCRVSIMWAEIEATAKQFPGIQTVKFAPDTLFQP